MAKKNNWEQQMLRSITDRFAETDIDGVIGSGDIYSRASVDVYEFTPNKDLDQSERYLLTGPDWSIIQQSSMLKGIHDMLGDRLGYGIDFEEWFKDFQDEFQRNLPSTKKPSAKKFRPWGMKPEDGPAKLNLISKEEARKRGYMVIRFWKRKSLQKKSMILAGTYPELRRELVEIMRGCQPANNVVPYSPPDKIKRRTQPRVFLTFIEDMKDVDPEYNPVVAEISFRIMDKTDDPKSKLPKITKADLKSLALKIKHLFFEGEKYVWKKGKEMYPYCCWEEGYQLQLLCRNKPVAKDLVKQVLAIQGHEYNDDYFTNNHAENPEKKYPIIPETITVLGEEVKEKRRRPIADVVFAKAHIDLQKWPGLITLIDIDGEVLPDFPDI